MTKQHFQALSASDLVTINQVGERPFEQLEANIAQAACFELLLQDDMGVVSSHVLPLNCFHNMIPRTHIMMCFGTVEGWAISGSRAVIGATSIIIRMDCGTVGG